LNPKTRNDFCIVDEAKNPPKTKGGDNNLGENSKIQKTNTKEEGANQAKKGEKGAAFRKKSKW